MISFVLFVPLMLSATAAPLQQTPDGRLSKHTQDTFPVSPETGIDAVNEEGKTKFTKKHTGKIGGSTKDPTNQQVLLSILNQKDRLESRTNTPQIPNKHQSDKVKNLKQNRKNKAIFVNYPFLLQHYPDLAYDFDYDNDYDLNVEERTPGGSKRYQESNIFYIRLPPTPYMYVPGLGYISQPPTYSTNGLRPHRPLRPRPVYHPGVNPFIKLPIDFVSNGKPTSVYQWQKKPTKKPVDDPNLENLPTEFVNNGKPTTIYQWQTNMKPVKRPDDVVNSLDQGPYVFNGKPASVYLLKPDGSSSVHKSIRQPDYEKDSNAYY